MSNQKRQKRVAAIHDISCFGKCSLTVALPIISAAGIECAVIPTAILSTHTGGFDGYTYRDLTDDILPIFNHWLSLDLRFDAAYSGFLGANQIDIVAEIFDKLHERGALIVADPVMADNGALYSLFPPDFPDGMRELCRRADIILPNITEAALMLGEEYREGPYTREYIEDILRKLAALPRRIAVLTGVYFDDNELGAACIDVKTGDIAYAMAKKIPGAYHGTGDVFASAFVADFLRRGDANSGDTNIFNARNALQLAANFTSASVERTRLAGTDIRYGVNFEEELYQLTVDN
jgi:pyridoxine kinase